MATFAYTGRARGGQTITGEFTADSMDAAVTALRRDQILVTKINPVKNDAAAPGAKKSRASRSRRRISPSSRGSSR